MKLKESIKYKIFGHSFPQEYCCLAQESIQNPFNVGLTTTEKDFFLNVSNTHIFLGYKPLLIGIFVKTISEEYYKLNHKMVCLSFQEIDFEPNMAWKGFTASNKSIGRMLLHKVREKIWGEYSILIYQGAYAEHSLISAFNQSTNRWKEKFRKQDKSNINLPDNLSDQVQIAYAVPRIISLITLANKGTMNMFPTDLHGPVGDTFYIGSLRHGGKANDQVQRLKKIVLSQVSVSCFRYAYSLGKNHMKDLQDYSNFELHDNRSDVFDFPVPKGVTTYYELEQQDSLEEGIHQLHFYRIVNKKVVNKEHTLAHVHRFYAQWRLNNKRPTEFYWR